MPPASAKTEPFLLLPEPRAMRSSLSKTLAESRRTAFTPAHYKGGELTTYSADEFAKLGLRGFCHVFPSTISPDVRVYSLNWPHLSR